MRGILLTAAVGALILSSTALAAIDVIYCEIPGHPKAVVPTGPALGVFAEFDAFDRPYPSPDGQRWIMNAETNLATTEDRVLIVFDGATASTVVREGQPIAGVTMDLVAFLDTRMGINNDGEYAFGVDTNGATTGDQHVVKFDRTGFSIVAREGQPASGGGNWAATQGSVHILNDGTVGFDSTASAGGSRVMHGSTVIGQSTVTVLANQPLGQTQTFSSLTTDFFSSSTDGSDTIFRCNLNGDTTVDEVIAVNGAVVLHEGMTIPGMANPINTTYGQATMSVDGDWIVRGSTLTDAEDYVVRNGTLIARTGGPIATGETELFDDTIVAACFFWQYENGAGDYVIGGNTDAADINANAVLVLNGTDVVAREGDMVDLNGNGVADDNAFISAFNNDDGFLTDDLVLVFTADLRDGATPPVNLGQAFLTIDLAPAPCPADIDGNDTIDVNDLLAVITTWGACPGCPPAACPGDISPPGGNCNIDVNDLLLVITTWGPCP